MLVLCKHEVSPWLPKRTARSAPATFSPPSRKLPPAAAQKFQTAYVWGHSFRTAVLAKPGNTHGHQDHLEHPLLHSCRPPDRQLADQWSAQSYAPGVYSTPTDPPPNKRLCSLRLGGPYSGCSLHVQLPVKLCSVRSLLLLSLCICLVPHVTCALCTCPLSSRWRPHGSRLRM